MAIESRQNYHSNSVVSYGRGYQTYLFEAIEQARYDAANELGLKGVPYNRLFPSLTGLLTTQGGAEDMGPVRHR